MDCRPLSMSYRQCYYNGYTTQHGQSLTESSLTCTCNDGNWGNCIPIAPLPSIVDNAIATPQLSTLVSVLTLPAYAPVLAALSGDGPFTVFAPTNEAFSRAGVDVNNAEAVTEVLKYHVLSGSVPSSDLQRYQEVPTLQGQEVRIEKMNGGVRVNDANVVLADVLSSNGVVHVIDSLLLPPSQSYRQCYYNGYTTQHGQSSTGPSLTCTCNDGNWGNCVRV